MHHPPAGPFNIPAINNVVPRKLKPFLIILFVIAFQLSGGIYLATLNQMVGDTVLKQEDIKMAGFASLCGMALTFPIMLRLKMRFLSKHSLLVTAAALIIANFISLYTSNVFVLVATCFFAGIFKMWATFECNSTIQLWLTPKRDLSIFFCFIYLLVPGAILLSGSTSMFVSWFTSWEYMHWFVIGTLLVVMLLTLLLFNSNRFMKAFLLFGIDWLGMIMWGLILLCINFISIYGEYYDWWSSMEIKIASIFLGVLLALNIYRASFIRHPFIALKTFTYKPVYLTFFLYLLIELLLSPQHLIEHIFYEKVLGYDATHLVQLNWMSWVGVIAGAGFTLYYFAIKKNSFKSTFLIGFSAIIVYLLLMYFQMDYGTTQASLLAPLFFRNFGYVVLAIVLLTNLTKVPFQNFHFFQSLAIQAFVSAACGVAFTEAILHHFFNGIATKNFQLLSSGFDRVNEKLSSIHPSQLGEQLQNQVLMVSFKEVYGYLLMLAAVSFVVLLLFKYASLPKGNLYPKMRTIRKILRRELQ